MQSSDFEVTLSGRSISKVCKWVKTLWDIVKLEIVVKSF